MEFDVPTMIHQARRDDAAALDHLLEVYRNYLRLLAQVWLADDLPGKARPV